MELIKVKIGKTGKDWTVQLGKSMLKSIKPALLAIREVLQKVGNRVDFKPDKICWIECKTRSKRWAQQKPTRHCRQIRFHRISSQVPKTRLGQTRSSSMGCRANSVEATRAGRNSRTGEMRSHDTRRRSSVVRALCIRNRQMRGGGDALSAVRLSLSASLTTR